MGEDRTTSERKRASVPSRLVTTVADQVSRRASHQAEKRRPGSHRSSTGRASCFESGAQAGIACVDLAVSEDLFAIVLCATFSFGMGGKRSRTMSDGPAELDALALTTIGRLIRIGRPSWRRGWPRRRRRDRRGRDPQRASPSAGARLRGKARCGRTESLSVSRSRRRLEILDHSRLDARTGGSAPACSSKCRSRDCGRS